MRTINPRWILIPAFLLAAPLMASEHNGILLTDDAAGATKETKAIKKEQDEVMKELIAGNKKHMANHSRKDGMAKIMIVSCADSRVPPEAVFHLPPGAIFTTRAFGNIVDKAQLASLEYAAEHLHSCVLIVLGHTGCTAIKEAIAEREHPRPQWRSLNEQTLNDQLEPAVAEVEEAQKVAQARTGKSLTGDALVEAIVKTNVISTIHTIREKSPLLWQMETSDLIKIVGAVYHIDTGKVEFIKE
ncbi:MAG TPA: carbonic anhydrase [bacterium]|nr:carbonic anhydrase [bacterium]